MILKLWCICIFMLFWLESINAFFGEQLLLETVHYNFSVVKKKIKEKLGLKVTCLQNVLFLVSNYCFNC